MTCSYRMSSPAVHLINVGQRQAAADPQTKPSKWSCEFACGLLSSTSTIPIYKCESLMSSSVRVKPGFHYLSWRPELTVPVSITRQHGPCWRARVSTIAESTRIVETGLNCNNSGRDKPLSGWSFVLFRQHISLIQEIRPRSDWSVRFRLRTRPTIMQLSACTKIAWTHSVLLLACDMHAKMSQYRWLRWGLNCFS